MDAEWVRIVRILKSEMSKKGITQKDLEQKLRIKQSQLSRYLSENVEPGIGTLSEIARALGFELWELLAPKDLKLSEAHNEIIRKIRSLDETACKSLLPIVDLAIQAAANKSKLGSSGHG